MGLYVLPEGAFESAQNSKHPAGIVMVWETAWCQSAGLAGDSGGGTALVLAHLPCCA